MSDLNILAGLDIGNGCVKGLLSDQMGASAPERVVVDIQSCCAYVTSTHDLKTPPEGVQAVVEDIFNEMDVSFDSAMVKQKNRRLFGRRGIQSGMPLEEFDVFSHISKARQDLSGILILGCVAGAALQTYYRQTGQLPQEILQASVRVALALPIQEYKKYREEYAGKLTKGTHIVTFHNFQEEVRVQVTFVDAQVVAEGASAQYAIIAKGAGFIQDALQDCQKTFSSLAGITAEDVISATTTMGVDIGEGTTNFPVFQNGKFNPDASVSMNKGYGTILTSTLDRLQDEGLAFNSRKELSDYIQTKPSAIKKGVHDRVMRVLEEETVAFVNAVKMSFLQVMGKFGATMEVAYVYGGGASPVQSLLYPELVDSIKAFSTEFPILYLDSRYSRYLNREGLFWVAEQVAQSVASTT